MLKLLQKIISSELKFPVESSRDISIFNNT